MVAPGRTFCRRLFDAVSELDDLDTPSPLSPAAIDDILWWHTCIEAWNGRALLVSPTWQKPTDLELFTDASDLGFGVVFGPDWAYGRWDPSQTGKSIEWRELYPIALVCIVLGEKLRNQRILAHCDNESVCAIWQSGVSRCPHIMCLVRAALLAAARYNTIIHVVHIRGLDNGLADSLSRLQVEKFKSLHRHANPDCLQPDRAQLACWTTAPWRSSLQEGRRTQPARMPQA